jgi:hypothetical protein
MGTELLFTNGGIAAVVRSIESTKVGKKLTNDTNKGDLWEVDRLDQHDKSLQRRVVVDDVSVEVRSRHGGRRIQSSKAVTAC